MLENPSSVLAAAGAITGVFAGLVMKHLTNRECVRRHRNRVIAHILEIRIYRDEVLTPFRSLGGLLKHTIYHLGHMLVPIPIIAIAVIAFSAWIISVYGSEPLKPGDETVLEIEKKQTDTPVTIDTPPSVSLLTPGVRADKSVFLRIRLNDTANPHVVITAGRKKLKYDIAVERGDFPPPAPPEDSLIKRVRIQYPSASYPLFKWNTHPLTIYFILMAAAMLATHRLIPR